MRTESGPLVLAVNLVPPAIIVALLRTPRRPRHLPAAWSVAALIGTSAAIHLALASSHAAEVPELGPLFRLDAVLLAAAVVGAVLAHRWPRIAPCATGAR